MATINAVILKGKELKKGGMKVRISVAHKSKTLFITTDIVIDSESQLRNNKIVRRGDAVFLTSKLNKIFRRYEEALIDIDQNLYTCAELVEIIKKSKTSRTSNTIAYATEVYVSQLSREKSIKLYNLVGNRFTKFMNGDIPLSSIKPADIQGFHDRLVNDGVSATTINIYMTLLKVIINNAKKLKMVSYSVDPFEVYKKPSSNIRELDISVTELRRVRDIELDKENLQVTRDIFMLSYYLAGMNVADMLEYDFKGKTTVCYVRKKTEHTKSGNNQICFTIQPEAKEIISKYISETGRLVFGKYETKSKVDNLLFRQIENLATIANIKKRVIYYTARKSFVQHGFELGIPLETLEYCIGQSMKTNRPIFNYVKIMSKHADLAIRQILDNLK